MIKGMVDKQIESMVASDRYLGVSNPGAMSVKPLVSWNLSSV